MPTLERDGDESNSSENLVNFPTPPLGGVMLHSEQSRSSPVVQELLSMSRADSLAEWLELPAEYTASEGQAALRTRMRWAKSMLNNPRYGALAYHTLRHKNQLEGHILDTAQEPMADSIARTLHTFWLGLQEVTGLSSRQRFLMLKGEARRIGIDPAQAKELVLRGSPSLGEAVVDALGCGGHPGAAVNEVLDHNQGAESALNRMKAIGSVGELLVSHPRKREAMLELCDGIRGLLMQKAMRPSTREALVREAYRNGLAPHRARRVVLGAVTHWHAYKTQSQDPFAVLGARSGCGDRRSYLRRRRQLISRIEGWADLSPLVKLDAAWTSLSS